MVKNIEEILELLPHRYPFLLIDRVLELSEESIVALKNVTVSEPYFQGHFPGKPVMPGVLIIETMAQAGAIMLHKASEGKMKLLVGVDKARFKRQVVPGDTLRIEVELKQVKGNFAVCAGQVLVEDTVAASAQLRTACL